MTTKLTGHVSRLVHISISGGAIFRMLEGGTSKSIRIVAPGKALSFVPELGETLWMTGQYSNDRKYGYQFTACTVVRCLPKGENIVKLLMSHTSFAWMDGRLARRLWKKFGQQLQVILASSDIVTLHRVARMSVSDAVKLVRTWREYANYIETSTYFATQGFPLEIVWKAMELWGCKTVTNISANPYLLVPLTGWSKIDTQCSALPGAKANDAARLVAACLSSAEDYLQRNRVMRMPLDVLKRLLVKRLGDASLATEALSLAAARGQITVDGKNLVSAQTIGMRILEDAFSRRAAALANMNPDQTTGSGVALSKADFVRISWKRPGVSILRVSCFGMLDLPNGLIEQALHIFSSASVRTAFGSTAKRTALISNVVGCKPAGISHASICLIYGAQYLHLAMATKLLYALPELCHMVIVTVGEVEVTPNSFWQFLTSLKSVSQLSLQTERAKPTSGTAADASSIAELSAVPNCFNPAVLRIEVAHPSAAQAKALAAYREASESDTALLLTLYKNHAARLNCLLHEEHMNLRRFLQLPIPNLSIYGRQVATIGDKVLARADIPDKDIPAGAPGIITDISVAAGELRYDGGSKLGVATVEFDTSGSVELTAAECRLLDFGYALSVELDTWSAVAHRIVIIEKPFETVSSHFRSHVSRTTKSFQVMEQSFKSLAVDGRVAHFSENSLGKHP